MAISYSCRRNPRANQDAIPIPRLHQASTRLNSIESRNWRTPLLQPNYAASPRKPWPCCRSSRRSTRMNSQIRQITTNWQAFSLSASPMKASRSIIFTTGTRITSCRSRKELPAIFKLRATRCRLLYLSSSCLSSTKSLTCWTSC